MVTRIRLSGFVLAVVVPCWLLLAARAAEPDKTRAVKAEDLQLNVPESWKQKPAGGFRVAQFEVPKVEGDADNGEFVVFYFGEQGGGDANSNIKRWVNQFQAKDRKVKITSGKSAQGDYVIVDTSGTWMKPIGPPVRQQTVETPNSRVVSVLLSVKDHGNYFLKLMGPQKTTTANLNALRAAIGADAKSEKDYKPAEE
jgi:hypothetical protein